MFYKKSLKKKYIYAPAFLISAMFFCLISFNILQAQSSHAGFDVVHTHEVADENVSSGDIISYNSQTHTYILSRKPGDKNMFGVVVSDPVFIFQKTKNGLPISDSGIVPVNVFLENWESIEPGDFITSSSVAGIGKEAGRGDRYILGVAKTPLKSQEAAKSTTSGGVEILSGKVVVDLKPGILKTNAENAFGAGETGGGWGQFSEATVTNVIQYILAAFVAIGSISVSFKNFMPNLEKGVISMGRNPRAKSSIKSMVIFNAFLMVIIGLGGIGLAIGIILLPI